MDKGSLAALRIDRTGPPPPGRRRRWWIGLGLALIAIAAASWWFTRPPTVRVAVVRDVTGNQPRVVLNASGYVTARLQATVSSKVTGKVVAVLIEEGDHVKAGQVLARLDDSNVRASLQLAKAQLASARADLAETRARLKQAQEEWQRIQRLTQAKIATASDRDNAEADLKAAQAHLAALETNVTVAQREVAVWQQQLDDTVIRAPFDGVITTKDAQPGEMISPVSAGGGYTRTGICTIVDMSSLEIEVDVNESYLDRVSANQPVQATLDAYPDWKIPGKVIAIIPTADRQKSTVKVRIGFDHLDPRILPEMAIRIAFLATGSAAKALLVAVPRRAVVSHDDRGSVWIVKGDHVERRNITTTGNRADETLVDSGLVAGETVVLDPSARLHDGERVQTLAP